MPRTKCVFLEIAGALVFFHTQCVSDVAKVSSANGRVADVRFSVGSWSDYGWIGWNNSRTIGSNLELAFFPELSQNWCVWDFGLLLLLCFAWWAQWICHIFVAVLVFIFFVLQLSKKRYGYGDLWGLAISSLIFCGATTNASFGHACLHPCHSLLRFTFCSCCVNFVAGTMLSERFLSLDLNWKMTFFRCHRCAVRVLQFNASALCILHSIFGWWTGWA